MAWQLAAVDVGRFCASFQVKLAAAYIDVTKRASAVKSVSMANKDRLRLNSRSANRAGGAGDR